ncbi:MAG: hypothetical protein WDN28_13250 [Chthoniobacter sp.]
MADSAKIARAFGSTITGSGTFPPSAFKRGISFDISIPRHRRIHHHHIRLARLRQAQPGRRVMRHIHREICILELVAEKIRKQLIFVEEEDAFVAH